VVLVVLAVSASASRRVCGAEERTCERGDLGDVRLSIRVGVCRVALAGKNCERTPQLDQTVWVRGERRVGCRHEWTGQFAFHQTLVRGLAEKEERRAEACDDAASDGRMNERGCMQARQSTMRGETCRESSQRKRRGLVQHMGWWRGPLDPVKPIQGGIHLEIG